ncbi:hypothetical protein HNQ73_000614 [Chelatococcus composti]|jgi:hypothetical protein|uniref:Uncharacterized protein n=1 Tax=Chelatococcus composti TaxID=1743235 RepID=A0A841KAF9_9HYPH|nr:hypothetical protein [Chelatococcus composti]
MLKAVITSLVEIASLGVFVAMVGVWATVVSAPPV